MDIYSAQKNIEKLLKYVEGLADTRPNMYEKSRDRLREVAFTCNQVVNVISEILQEEVLLDDTCEFGGSVDVSSVLESMQSQLDQLRQFAGMSKREEQDTGQKGSVTTRNKSQILREYRSCLSKLSTIDSGLLYVDDCAKLLWTWFDVRFFKLASESNFRYNMRRFPGWIRDIVMLYGHAVHQGKQYEFMTEFQNWIELISTSDAKDKYAVPYSVYQFNRNPDKEQATLEATVIWDMLVNFGLKEICKRRDEFYPSEESVYEMCDKLNPSSLDDYVSYEDHPEIFKQLGWQLKGGIEDA